MRTSDQSRPTVFHITHWKSGSQWVRGVFLLLDRDRVVLPDEDMSNVRDDRLVRGAIYSPVYMASRWFDRQVTPSEAHRCIVVIRDLRDSAVSWYFSMRYSHGVINDQIAENRARLDQMSFEDGLMFVVTERLDPFADIQRSWLRKPEHARLIIRYEELISNEYAEFGRIFDWVELDATAAAREAAIRAESFLTRTGRTRGVERIEAHHRKGVAGDWRNHFTDDIKDAFKERFGELLIETGYESDLNW